MNLPSRKAFPLPGSQDQTHLFLLLHLLPALHIWSRDGIMLWALHLFWCPCVFLSHQIISSETLDCTHQAGRCDLTAGNSLRANEEVVLLLADSHLEERHMFSVARREWVISNDILLESPLSLNLLYPNLPLKNLYLPTPNPEP